MNIVDELKLMAEKDYATIHDHFMEQMEVLQQKFHLFKVIKLITEVEKSIVNGGLNDLGVVSLDFKLERKQEFYFRLKAYDDDDNTIQKITNTGITKLQFQGISFALNELRDVRKKYLGEFDSVTININENLNQIKEKLLNMFLSNELRKILDYSEMQLQLNSSEQVNSNKKIKV